MAHSLESRRWAESQSPHSISTQHPVWPAVGTALWDSPVEKSTRGHMVSWVVGYRSRRGGLGRFKKGEDRALELDLEGWGRPRPNR